MTEVAANDDLSCLTTASKNTLSFIENKLSPTCSAINNCLDALGNDVFQGPAADSCKKGLEDFIAVIKNPMIVNFEKISTTLTEAYNLLTKADDAVKKNISFVYDEKSMTLRLNTLPSNLKVFDNGTVLPIALGKGVIENYGQHGSSVQGGYGGAHNGIDITAPIGTTIYAPANAKVAYVGNRYEWGYGNCVVLEFYSEKAGKNMAVILAHMREVPNLTVGQSVSAGTAVGHVGATGYVLGAPHLHMEIRDNTVYRDSTGSYGTEYLYGTSV